MIERMLISDIITYFEKNLSRHPRLYFYDISLLARAFYADI